MSSFPDSYNFFVFSLRKRKTHLVQNESNLLAPAGSEKLVQNKLKYDKRLRGLFTPNVSSDSRVEKL